MTKQHEPAKNSKFDLMQTLRKPHGMVMIAVIIGVLGWAMWTFIVW
jgi:hypothetical protein